MAPIVRARPASPGSEKVDWINAIEPISRIMWGEDSEYSVEDLLNGRNSEAAKGKQGEASEWLSEYLRGKDVLITVAKADAKAAGHSKATLDRAKAALPIFKVWDAEAGAHKWHLQTKTSKSKGVEYSEVSDESEVNEVSAPGRPHTKTSEYSETSDTSKYQAEVSTEDSIFDMSM